LVLSNSEPWIIVTKKKRQQQNFLRSNYYHFFSFGVPVWDFSDQNILLLERFTCEWLDPHGKSFHLFFVLQSETRSFFPFWSMTYITIGWCSLVLINFLPYCFRMILQLLIFHCRAVTEIFNFSILLIHIHSLLMDLLIFGYNYFSVVFFVLRSWVFFGFSFKPTRSQKKF